MAQQRRGNNIFRYTTIKMLLLVTQHDIIQIFVWGRQLLVYYQLRKSAVQNEDFGEKEKGVISFRGCLEIKYF
jgi:hypothetical protein